MELMISSHETFILTLLWFHAHLLAWYVSLVFHDMGSLSISILFKSPVTYKNKAFQLFASWIALRRLVLLEHVRMHYRCCLNMKALNAFTEKIAHYQCICITKMLFRLFKFFHKKELNLTRHLKVAWKKNVIHHRSIHIFLKFSNRSLQRICR